MVDLWINAFYGIVNNLGFPDPIHVTLVHIPMGLIIGAFFFALFSAFSRSKKLSVASYHCMGLAVLFLIPTILFGLMDWRHFYVGGWLFPIIIKMILAVILFGLSSAVFLLGVAGKGSSKVTLFLCGVCVITVIALGWYGARIVYGESEQISSKNYPVGAKIFAVNCSTCHSGGGNKFEPDQPLKTSDALKDFKDFLSQIRQPDEPMPKFTTSRIPDKDAKELFDYITNEIKCSKVPQGTHPHK